MKMYYLGHSDQMTDRTGTVLADHIIAILQSEQTGAQKFAHNRSHFLVKSKCNLREE